MKKRFLSMALSLAMLLGLSVSASAYAAEQSGITPLNADELAGSVVDLGESNYDALDTFSMNDADVIGISDAEFGVMAVAEDELTPLFADLGTQPCNSFTVTLNENQAHFLKFQVTKSQTMFSKFTTGNSNYGFALYLLNAEGQFVRATEFYAPGSNIDILLPAGIYAFGIFNFGGTFGSQYTIAVNTSTPGDGVTGAALYKANQYYSHVVTLVEQDGKKLFYCDGKLVTDLDDTSKLKWERVLDLSWSGGYNYNKHSISDVKFTDISLPGVYKSDYVNSDNAVIIYLDVGTSYMYNESKRNWDTGYHLFHFLDPFGNETPRRLNELDIDEYQCWLIFDLDKGESIDFCSALNWYYATGTETASFGYK